jgi:S1-C subfamily serine protease
VPGDLLDLILIAVVAAFAVAGYRQGFIIGVLSLVGFLAGVAAGAYLAPAIARALAKSTNWQAFLAILVVFALAVIGMMVASGIGVALRSRVIGRPATVVDALGGATVNVVAVLIVAWLIGSFVINSSAFPAVSRQVNDSAVLRTVDRVMPRNVLYLPFFPQLRNLLSNGLYTQVFGALGAAESAAGVPAPNPSVVSATGLTKAEPSIVKVTGEATSCSQTIEGSGFVISSQHVLTNAHVVAGVDVALSVTTASGAGYRAQVVLYDPERDLAVLYVPGLRAAPLSFGGQASEGTSAAVAGYPMNHALTVVPATVGPSFTATGPDIYQTGSVNRQMYAVRAVIEPGNSGGPLVSPDGQVYGVVFAASTYYQETGYALTAAEVASDVAAGTRDYSPVATEGCQDG